MINQPASTSTLVLANIVAPVGLIIILAATMTPFFLMNVAWARTAFPFVYSAGALVLLAARLFARYNVADARLRRLRRLETWSPAIFCVAAFFLFYNGGQMRDWLAFTLAGAALQVFTSLAIPARERKLAKEKNDK